MSKEICISSTPHETRLAIIEDDQLTEVYYERENEYTLAGSIYKGRVTRVLPGMQSAFVDLGLERDAFLYVTDFLEEQEDSAEFERVPANGAPERVQDRGQERERSGRDQPVRGQQSPKETRPASSSEPAASGQEGSAAAPGEQFAEGTRRWRGRRGRRNRGGGRPQPWQQGQQPQQRPPGTVQGDVPEPSTFEPAAQHHEDTAPTTSKGSPAIPSYLPGESLSKYGQVPAKETARPADGVPPQPKAAFTPSKPSTLIETPIEWDGSGLLVGESLSRYRDSGAPRPVGIGDSQQDSHRDSTPELTPELTLDRTPDLPPDLNQDSAHFPLQEAVESLRPQEIAAVSESDLPEVVPVEHGEALVKPLEIQPSDAVLPPIEHGEKLEEEAIDEESIELEPADASASYRVDPFTRSEFRVGGSTATEFEPALEPTLEPIVETEPFPAIPEIERYFRQERSEEQWQEERSPRESGAESRPESVLAPGIAQDQPQPGLAPNRADGQVDGEVNDEVDEDSDEDFDDTLDLSDLAASPEGLVEEEEVSEEEEYDFMPLYAHAEDHDLEDMEEETLDQQAMAGAGIDDLVRDTHIEQRVNAEAGELTIDEEEADEEAAEEAPAAPAAGQPARRDRPQQREDQRRDSRGGRHDRRRHNGRRQSAQTSELPIISELLKQGQEILVQIAKEPIAKKGARITSHIALPGRFLVFMPTVNHVGVSRKISSDEERQRLKRILISEKGAGPGGFIVRTAADGASEEDLRADIRFLIGLWAEIKQREDAAKAPALIYHDLNLVERILRDQVSDNFSTIWVDNEAEYERIVRFLNRFQPSLVRRAKLYTKETPLFEQFGIQEEIGKALKSKVWLKSGGSIVINQTEALVAIDINTGKYVGKTARLEDTILKTNLDAIPEIVRQIRLRDLGGIIVIDFIDMDERKNRHKVMQALEEALKADRAPSKVLQFNDFGLVAITRKRVKQSLERTLCVQCGICAGTGMTKSPVTVCNEIYIEMRKMQRHLERHDVLLRVHPEVVKTLKAGNARWLSELEEMSGKTIIVKSDPALHPEQFDIH